MATVAWDSACDLEAVGSFGVLEGFAGASAVDTAEELPGYPAVVNLMGGVLGAAAGRVAGWPLRGFARTPLAEEEGGSRLRWTWAADDANRLEVHVLEQEDGCEIGFYFLLALAGAGAYLVGSVGGHPIVGTPAFTFCNSDGSTPDTLLTDTPLAGSPLEGLVLDPGDCARWMSVKLRKFVLSQVH